MSIGYCGKVQNSHFRPSMSLDCGLFSVTSWEGSLSGITSHARDTACKHPGDYSSLDPRVTPWTCATMVLSFKREFRPIWHIRWTQMHPSIRFMSVRTSTLKLLKTSAKRLDSLAETQEQIHLWPPCQGRSVVRLIIFSTPHRRYPADHHLPTAYLALALIPTVYEYHGERKSWTKLVTQVITNEAKD